MICTIIIRLLFAQITILVLPFALTFTPHPARLFVRVTTRATRVALLLSPGLGEVQSITLVLQLPHRLLFGARSPLRLRRFW